MSAYILTFASALGLTAAITPLVIRFAHATNLLDRPGPRKAHRTSVPRLGGVAVVLGVAITMVCLAAKGTCLSGSLRDHWSGWAAFAVGSILVFGLGLIDDIRGLPASSKMPVQIAAACLVAGFGIRLESLRLDDHLVINLGVLAWPLTVLWIVGITNAVNLIDGLDGLAAGITTMAALVVAGLAMAGGQPALGLVMIAVAGAVLGFMIFNFHPARIFLGDCGAMWLGFVLATASVRSTSTTGRTTDLALPALVLVLPILDTANCIFRRAVERRSVFSSDRGHIHHRLLDNGFSQRKVALSLYAVTAMAAGLGLPMLMVSGVGIAIIFLSVLLLVIQFLKAIGAMPLRENVIAMQRSRAISQLAHQGRRAFERSRLRFERVDCFDQWWAALCAAAEELHLSRITLWFSGTIGASGYREWRASQPPRTDRLHTTLLLRALPDGPPGIIEVEAPVDGAFESASCCIQFFARLIDENPPASFAAHERTEVAANDESPAEDEIRAALEFAAR